MTQNNTFVTEPVSILVTRQEVSDYCQAIGEKNPLFYDIRTAQAAGYADIVLPLTYPILFWKHIHIPWLAHTRPLIHREQTFTYKGSLLANETYTCLIALTDIRKRKNKQYLRHELMIAKHEETIATSETTLVQIKE
ncbi:MAG TPA: MaoC family dehydratase N-terminal domain-containing protein [Bacillota bacterium]|nr:MaoC family dehydratase N-terminal domain-containing protein [Bacillota bacterium]